MNPEQAINEIQTGKAPQGLQFNTTDLDTLRDSYNALPWYKKMFYNPKLKRSLNAIGPNETDAQKILQVYKDLTTSDWWFDGFFACIQIVKKTNSFNLISTLLNLSFFYLSYESTLAYILNENPTVDAVNKCLTHFKYTSGKTIITTPVTQIVTLSQDEFITFIKLTGNQSKYHNQLLYTAARLNKTLQIEILLTYNPDLLYFSPEIGYALTPIELMMNHLTPSEFEEMVRHVDFKKTQNSSAEMVLHRILKQENSKEYVIEGLIAQGAPLDYKDTEGNGPLEAAIFSGSVSKVKLMLKALNMTQDDWAQYLITARPNKKPPLFEIIEKNQRALFDFVLNDEFVKKVISESNVAYEDMSLFSLAIRYHIEKIYDICLPRVPDSSVNLYFKEAMLHDREELAISLMDRASFNIEEISNDGRNSFLALAIKHGLIKLATILIEKSPENIINFQDSRGDTPLILATKQDQSLLVNMLLQKNANVDIENKNGYTAYLWAQEYRKFQIAELIQAKNPAVGINNWASVLGEIQRKEKQDSEYGSFYQNSRPRKDSSIHVTVEHRGKSKRRDDEFQSFFRNILH
ncbi:ankyrin repeat domain-containing protein [Legionella waltersii]|uniref:Ankyrin repeat protein n=1 Tax=Legionella waltersii TaxID=66969 RepID=A0A0W1A0E3_9GAMM|nr:ankyrin repeat domain-containing protein [Legionella waltersii]KTD74837.1 ankyrin repeat protein [Legionella waltersii]SNV11756.1 ankyrin repeat protein [Legionella waltersii]